MCFVAFGISKLYSVLFSTFWLLFIQSYYPNGQLNDYEEAKLIYSNVMIISIVFGVLLVPICGKIADTCNPQIVMPLAFLCRAVGISGFWFIQSPSGWYSYVISVFLVLFTVMETTVIDCIILRSAEKEIRGIIFGSANSCGYLGQLIFALVGGILYDRVGPKMPFVYVGLLDAFMFTLSCLCVCCGVLKNDILERE